MNSLQQISLLLLICTCILLGTGCSTRRNTLASRTYHELTTRYNSYHNAQQVYTNILDDQLDHFVEDYSTLLPYYPSPVNGTLQTGGGPFDPVIDKLEKTIREHSIAAKPRRDPTQRHSPEYRRWLDQNEFNPFIHRAWLLMGKAHLQNGNPGRSASIFQEIMHLFGEDSPAAEEARLWMARAYIDGERFNEAEQALFQIGTLPIAPHLRDLYHEIRAYYHLQTGAYDQAIPYLKLSIDAEKRFKQKKRLQFLLGQLYTMMGEKEQARRAFKNVRSLSTPRELTRQALAYQTALHTGSDSLAHQLKRSVNPRLVPINAQETATRTIDSIAHSHHDPTMDFLRERSLRSNHFHYGTKEIAVNLEELLRGIPIGIPQPVPRAAPDLPEKVNAKTEKIVSLKTTRDDETVVAPSPPTTPPITPEALLRRLQENEAKALRESGSTRQVKNREQLLRERERLRQARVKEREQAMKEREKERQERLKLRELERRQRIRQQRSR